jgi:hypothetical protein
MERRAATLINDCRIKCVIKFKDNNKTLRSVILLLLSFYPTINTLPPFLLISHEVALFQQAVLILYNLLIALFSWTARLGLLLPRMYQVYIELASLYSLVHE